MTDFSIVSVVVMISARTEWRVVRNLFPSLPCGHSPYGEWFGSSLELDQRTIPVVFFHGGWGKIDAAASTQYAIDRWSPELLINMGTCGGFQGEIACGEVILAERTLVYDIIEQMGDPDAAIAHYTTDLDLSWLREPYPQTVRRGLLISADRDIVAHEIPALKARFQAFAADWESGAIAHVASRNGVRCLILRVVTDLVGPEGGEAYDGTVSLFARRTQQMMKGMVTHLGAWLSMAL